MTQFGKMIGGGGEFRTAVKNKLQDFRHGSDYIIFHEVFGNLKREHYVIFSEKLANALRVVDWYELADFKSIEVGNTDNSTTEATIDNELMKFIVETTGKEWISEYQTTNPTEILEEIRRQKVEIMIKQAKIETEKSGKKDVNWKHLENRLKWAETDDISYDQLKSFADSERLEHLEHLEHLKPVSPFDQDAVHHYSETFEDGKKTVKEWGSKPSDFGQVDDGSSSSGSNMIKYCPDCRGKGIKVFLGDNFCRNCSRKLVEESQIQEVTDQEARQIEQQRPFFPKPKGNF